MKISSLIPVTNDDLKVSIRVETLNDEVFKTFKIRAWAVVDDRRIEPVFISDIGAMVTVSQYGDDMKEGEGSVDCDYEIQYKDGSVPA